MKETRERYFGEKKQPRSLWKWICSQRLLGWDYWNSPCCPPRSGQCVKLLQTEVVVEMWRGAYVGSAGYHHCHPGLHFSQWALMNCSLFVQLSLVSWHVVARLLMLGSGGLETIKNYEPASSGGKHEPWGSHNRFVRLWDAGRFRLSFSHLVSRNDNNTDLLRLLWGRNVLKHANCSSVSAWMWDQVTGEFLSIPLETKA